MILPALKPSKRLEIILIFIIKNGKNILNANVGWRLKFH